MQNEAIDRLNDLPGDILLSILSYLPFKEVVRTSIVSHKWEHMWRYVPILQFEDPRRWVGRFNRKNSTKQEKTAFVRVVDGVLVKHLGSVIDEFKIKFNMDVSSGQDHIDKWVSYALSKQVKKLEVDFNRINSMDPLCTLRIDFVKVRFALTSFTLKCVNVTGKQIENLLLCCPLLENLCIKESDIMTGVSICGSSSLPLKYLEILLCPELTTIDISAPKLISFIYQGEPITLRVIRAPLLSKVVIGTHVNPLWFAFESLSKYFSQLEEFGLDIHLREESNLRINHVPALPNLKHLKLRVFMGCHMSCLGWAPLIEASPVLTKLSSEISCAPYHIPKKISKYEGCRPLKSLKTLELRGRTKWDFDLELISYVIENAPILEEVIASPYFESSRPIPKDELVELEKLLPPGVKLTVNKNNIYHTLG